MRASEVIESVRLINNKDAITNYYNSERQTLEHFKFQEIFLRHTKKAYLSFVTPKMLELVQKKNDDDSICNIPSFDTIRHICIRKGVSMDMRLCRKIHASYLHKCGISEVMIDLLQGRVGKTVLVNHYLAPNMNLKTKALKGLEDLRLELEEL